MSFDGSNKTSFGGGQNIAYHLAVNPQVVSRCIANASPEAIAAIDPLNYTGPTVVRDASEMTQQEWQEIRQQSIGSSAAGQAMGYSPYPNCTNMDLYYSKIGIAPAIEDSKESKNKQELMFLYGHLMEDYLRKWVELRWPGCRVVVDTNIYASPAHPFLTANLDAMMQTPDGNWVHLEFKTANEFGEDAYANDSIPPHYKAQLIQCQHILGVYESRLIVAFSRDNVITRTYYRDLDEELRQVEMLDDFWNNHVLPQIPPDPRGPSQNVIATIRKFTGKADQTGSTLQLSSTSYLDYAKELYDINRQIAALEASKKKLMKLKEEAMIPFALAMGNYASAEIDDGSGKIYRITWKARAGSRKCRFDELKEDYPDIYDSYVSQEEEGSRPMSIKEVTAD